MKIGSIQATDEVEPLVEAIGLVHAFGATTVLEPTDLAVRRNEIVAMLGPSGCGKTTLLRLLSGLIQPTGGLLRRTTGDCAFVFQRPVLLPWRTALDNVLLPVELHGKVSAADRERADQLLALVGLGGFEHHRPAQLSGGMQQRVALARALIERPSVMFLDEPFSALDEMTREEMNLELLRVFQMEPELQAAVLVTHSIEEAAFLADRVVVLSGRPGRVLDVIDVDLPRPRVLDHKDSERFHACIAHLRRVLRSDAPSQPS
ncbi:MAG: ABC transporter ATP-binding protein [Acidimicrobiales bacterium]